MMAAQSINTTAGCLLVLIFVWCLVFIIKKKLNK